MSENARLTSEQSKVVRELKQAVEAFGAESTYTPEALRKRVADIVVKFRELESLFPEVAKAAAEYYESDFPEEPTEKDGYGDALFDALLDLHSFYAAEGFSRVVSAYESLSDSVYALATFSEEFSVDKGCWVSELV
jgi:hypothetical protein